MKIVQYINELIQQNGSITIPDFGTFLLKDTSTKIDDNKKTIVPPSKVLTFDENLKENNNILIEYLVKAEGLTIENADDAIKKFVFQLKTLLNSGKTIDFRNIGKLHLNNKKQIVLECDSKAEYVSELYGLTPVKTKTFFKTKEVTIKDKTSKEDKPKKKFPKAAIWLIIIFVPLIAVAVLAYLYQDKTKEIFSNSKEFVSGLFKKSEPDKNIKNVSTINDTLKDKVKVKTNNSDSVKTKPIENIENNNNREVVKPIVDKNKKFHIIVGCFQSKTNAENYFKTIESKGYTARFFEAGSDGLYKISCGSYATREEAKQELKKVSKDIGAQAWILKK